MKPLGEIKRHFWLAQRMAKAGGADLSGAAEDGRLKQAEWAGMVHACRACDWVGGCKRWLAKSAKFEEFPADCRNKSRFEALLKSAGAQETTAKGSQE